MRYLTMRYVISHEITNSSNTRRAAALPSLCEFCINDIVVIFGDDIILFVYQTLSLLVVEENAPHTLHTLLDYLMNRVKNES